MRHLPQKSTPPLPIQPTAKNDVSYPTYQVYPDNSTIKHNFFKAKGKASATKGFYDAGPGNKFYGVLHQAGFTPVRLLPIDCYTTYTYGIGLTDLVHTESGNDHQTC